MAKVYKVKISGSYRTDEIGKYADFAELEGIVPYCDQDVAVMNVIKRYAQMWIKLNPKQCPRRVNSVRQVFVDDIIESEADLSFIGKDIKKMTFEELQDLACAKDLREIPFFQKGSLRDAQQKAYLLYSKNILKTPIDTNGDNYNFAKLPPLFVGSASRRDDTIKLTNEEVLAAEQGQNVPQRQALTLNELKEIAKMNNVEFHPNISYDKLYARIYQAA